MSLPQDIILFLKYSGFKQKYNNIYEQIINYYQKGEHRNLYYFLETMKNTKNVIYTFSSIEEPLLPNQNKIINTEMFGKINKDNLCEIMISSLTSENQLEEELENFYFSPAKKIIVFKFYPYETDIMNYIKFFIENQIVEKFLSKIEDYNSDLNKNKYKKAFIFLIHLNRIFNKDLNDPQKEKYIKRNQLGELISHLSDFYQIFIDNLNGGDYSLLQIMEYKGEMLFRKCLDLNKAFMSNIYKAFSYFNYKFKIKTPYLNENNYSKLLINYLLEEKEFSDKIINCVLKQPIQEKDIFYGILKRKYINQKDVDIIHTVKRYLSELFTDNLTQFVFKSEQEHFLSTILYNKIFLYKDIDFEFLNEEKNNFKYSIFDEYSDDEIEEELNIFPDDDEIIINTNQNEEKKKPKNSEIIKENDKIGNINMKIDKEKRYFLGNDIIKELIDFYLEIFDASSSKKYSKIIKNNNINILIGLKLPGIKNIIEGLRTYIKTELKNKYLQIENNIRNLSKEEKDKELQKNKNILNNYATSLESEIMSKDLFKFLNQLDKENYSEDLNQFYDWLLNDYFLLFLSDSLQDIKYDFHLLENYKKFLKKCIKLRFNILEKNDFINSFAKKILWLESNKGYIDILIDIYKKLSINENNLILKIDKIIDSQEIQYEKSERCPYFTEEFNAPFFFLNESLLKISISDYEIYKKIKPKDFQNFFISLKTILQNAFNIQNNINAFYSKEIFTLQEFLIIYEKLNDAEQNTKENILTVLQILSEQSRFLNNILKEENNYKDICSNIENLYNFLYEKLENTDNFAELMLYIFVDEVKKLKIPEYRKKLTEIILKNPKLIKYSYPFFFIIIDSEISSEISGEKTIETNLESLENNMNMSFHLINEANNEALNQIILSIFENIFNIYFNSIPNCEDEILSQRFRYYHESNKENLSFILLDFSLDLFRDCLNYLENAFNNRNNKDNNRNNQLISSLYCIAYIKMYLYKSIYYIQYFNQQFLHFNEINEAIIGNSENDFRKVIKIYVFKIFFYLNHNFYYNVDNINYSNKGITFYKDIENLFNENKESTLNYYFLPIGEEYNKYSVLSNLFEEERISKFSNPLGDIKKLIEENGIDIYFSVSSNLIISNLCLKNYDNSEEYKNYSSFAKNLFEKQLKIPIIMKKLIYLFSKEEEFKRIIAPKIVEKEEDEEEKQEEEKVEEENILEEVVEEVKEEEKKEEKNQEQEKKNEENIIINKKISPKLLEILLYSLRFCIQSSDKKDNEKYLYSELFSQEYNQIIDNNCIPGNNLINNIYVNNYKKIENHLKIQPSNRGVYVCSCGLYYIKESRGFSLEPETEKKDVEYFCKNCKKKLGYLHASKEMSNVIYKMILSEGHYHIFKDEEQKKNEMKFYGEKDKDINSILLENYKNKIIQPILEKNQFGINIIPRNFYEESNLTVRNLSQIGFRLLNFILYSHLFFSNCLGFISDEDLKNKYLCNGMSCIDMIVANWDLLKDNLQSKYGIIIQIFMNLIYGELSQKIKKCKFIKTNAERENFENEIEKIIQNTIDNYENNSKQYIDSNINELQINKDNMKSLLLENLDVNLYNKDLYPFYKYFFMTTYPSERKLAQELKKIPEYENKYPLLSSYLNIIQAKINNEGNIIRNEDYYKPQKVELIKYLPEFNEFSNLMIDFYSYKISREEASNIHLNREEMYSNNEGGFQDLCDNFIKIWKEIGPYAIKYDNQILPEMTYRTDMTLDYFLNDVEIKGKGMYIASAYQNFITWQNNFLDKILEPLKNNPFLNHFAKNIEKKIDVQKAKKAQTLNFDEVNEEFSIQLFSNCKRDIFIDDNKINYINYKKLVYDFDFLEKYLGRRLLINKTRFNDYKKLKYVTYCFEAFKENKNSILVEFKKYYTKQISLDINYKQKIYDYIGELLIDNNEDFKKILFSIQLLIYYLSQENKNPKDEIIIIIRDLPFYVNISNEAKNFFEKLEIKVEELLEVYLFIELITVNSIIKNLNQKYKTPLDKEAIKEIKLLFEQNKFSIIKKHDLYTACRKIISRYLINTVEDIDGNENNSLELYLDREELWEKEIWDKNELLHNDLNLLKKYNITIGQCYELYMLLKEKDDIDLKGIELKKDYENEKNKLMKSTELKIIPKKRKKY